MSLAAVFFVAYLFGWAGHVLYRRIFGEGVLERTRLERDEAVSTMTSYYDRIQKLEAARDVFVDALQKIEDASRSVRTIVALQSIGRWAREALAAAAKRPGRCDFSVEKGAYMCELEKGHAGPCGSLPHHQP